MKKREKNRERISKEMGIRPGKIYNMPEIQEILGLSYAQTRLLIDTGRIKIMTDKQKWIKIAGYQIIDYLVQ